MVRSLFTHFSLSNMANLFYKIATFSLSTVKVYGWANTHSDDFIQGGFQRTRCGLRIWLLSAEDSDEVMVVADLGLHLVDAFYFLNRIETHRNDICAVIITHTFCSCDIQNYIFTRLTTAGYAGIVITI